MRKKRFDNSPPAQKTSWLTRVLDRLFPGERTTPTPRDTLSVARFQREAESLIAALEAAGERAGARELSDLIAAPAAPTGEYVGELRQCLHRLADGALPADLKARLRAFESDFL